MGHDNIDHASGETRQGLHCLDLQHLSTRAAAVAPIVLSHHDIQSNLVEHTFHWIFHAGYQRVIHPCRWSKARVKSRNYQQQLVMVEQQQQQQQLLGPDSCWINNSWDVFQSLHFQFVFINYIRWHSGGSTLTVCSSLGQFEHVDGSAYLCVPQWCRYDGCALLDHGSYLILFFQFLWTMIIYQNYLLDSFESHEP